MKTKNFNSKVIGSPNFKAREKLKEHYEKITDEATELEANLGSFFNEDVSIDEIMAFLKVKDARKYLTKRYIEKNGIEFPGLDPEVIIEQDQADIPKEKREGALEKRKVVNDLLWDPILKTNRFYFPLEKLFIQDQEENEPASNFFGLTEEFNQALMAATEDRTKNEEQNKVLASVQKVAAGYNELVEQGILNSPFTLEKVNNILKQALTYNKEESRFEPHPKMFFKRVLNPDKVE